MVSIECRQTADRDPVCPTDAAQMTYEHDVHRLCPRVQAHSAVICKPDKQLIASATMNGQHYSKGQTGLLLYVSAVLPRTGGHKQGGTNCCSKIFRAALQIKHFLLDAAAS